jgi:CRISP-associated protein Cas1
VQILNCLYVTTPGSRISARRDSLEVRREDALVGRFPLAGTEAVIAVGRIECTTDALARCVSHGVRVAFLDRAGRLRFQLTGPTTGNVNLRQRQVRLADDPQKALRTARMFVAGKLQNQRRAVQRWSWDAPTGERWLLDEQQARIEDRLRTVGSAPSGDHLRGIEGDATRGYFKALGAHLHRCAPDFAFVRRSRRPPRDPVNCVLSFLYSLITSEAIGALETVGLDPQIGFLHGTRPGRASLALDLIEELRTPLADRVAVSLFSRRQLGPAHFQTVADQAWYLNDEGRSVIFTAINGLRSGYAWHPLLERDVPRAALPSIQATLLARHIRGDLPAYPPFVMKP